LYILKRGEAMKVKIAKWGNSLGLRLPRAAVEATGLRAGAEVDVTIEGRDLRVRSFLPVKHYRLEDLVAEMKRIGPENEPETVDWGPDRGSEIIDDAYSRGEITLEDILTGKAKAEKAKGKDAS
jgi:antitoxin MazE